MINHFVTAPFFVRKKGFFFFLHSIKNMYAEKQEIGQFLSYVHGLTSL